MNIYWKLILIIIFKDIVKKVYKYVIGIDIILIYNNFILYYYIFNIIYVFVYLFYRYIYSLN